MRVDDEKFCAKCMKYHLQAFGVKCLCMIDGRTVFAHVDLTRMALQPYWPIVAQHIVSRIVESNVLVLVES